MCRRPRSSRGFTLVELVLVIVVGSVLAATLTVFLKPAVEGYVSGRSRADLADQADTALRRVARDVRVAVPNSIRTPGPQCFEVVPSSTGGRYRMEADPAGGSAVLDPAQAATTAFDVLSPLSSVPAVGDWVVVGNQNPNDVYAGVNAAQITDPNVATTTGTRRIAIASKQFPSGYAGGRFTVVPNAQQSVFYVCSGAGVDASGNGTGTLYRLVRNFTAPYPSSCPSTTGAAILATRVASCSFVYDPNSTATQQNGFVWMQLTLARSSESATLAMGAHVDNAP